MFDFVNSYYEQVSPIIRTFKGFFVKYMGDGIMAVFPNRADDALQAAITKQQCVAEYNEHRLKKSSYSNWCWLAYRTHDGGSSG